MRCGLLIATVATLALFTASSAMAGMINYVTTWNNVGTSPRGLEVDGSGNVYVADLDGNQVLKYNSSGTLLKTIAPATGDGVLNSPVDVAVSPIDGSIYVGAATSPEYVRKYASDGTYVTRWSQSGTTLAVATDSSGNVYANDAAGTISKWDASGTPITTWTGSGGNGLALNAGETTAYSFGGNNFNSVNLSTGTKSVLASLINGASRGAVAVNSVTGNIYVVERAVSAVQEFASDGTLIRNWDTWGAPGSGVSYTGTPSFPGGTGNIWGIAVNSATNNIYVADQSGHVVVFNEGAPSPEPGTITLLVTGLIGLLAYAWRKRR